MFTWLYSLSFSCCSSCSGTDSLKPTLLPSFLVIILISMKSSRLHIGIWIHTSFALSLYLFPPQPHILQPPVFRFLLMWSTTSQPQPAFSPLMLCFLASWPIVTAIYASIRIRSQDLHTREQLAFAFSTWVASLNTPTFLKHDHLLPLQTQPPQLSGLPVNLHLVGTSVSHP